MLQKIKLSLLMFFVVVIGSAAFANEPVQPLPQTLNLNPDKVDLGDKLFHDPRLSKDNSISCASCHDLNKGGCDQRKVSLGVSGQLGGVNAPTVYNSFFNILQFWDGRAKDLKEQANGPVNNPKEMGTDWNVVVTRLENDPAYSKMFFKVYGGKISAGNIADAIAEYEHSLITPSRFDDYLRGDQNALTPQEKRGYALFKSFGCASCHNGINLGGTQFRKMGIYHDYFKDRGTPITPADLGRYNVTHLESDKYVFKVPTLRNIELTYPYFHDGSVNSLRQAVIIMGKYESGINISSEDADDIVAFLCSLTGKDLIEKQVNKN
jgi:cytochrome c peroxidase